MNLLTQNSKMKKSSAAGYTVVNWTIPAFKSSTGLSTCPNAGSCAAGCYARSGTYRFSNVLKAHEVKLEITKHAQFKQLIIADIKAWLDKPKTRNLKVRIHDAGDFYSEEYLNDWFFIMGYFSSEKRVSFYAYTKQVQMLKRLNIPNNFTVIYSLGGKQDKLINLSTDMHSRVFESEEDLVNAGYLNATEDDLVAGLAKSTKIGLVYHGAKNYNNTLWPKVGG